MRTILSIIVTMVLFSLSLQVRGEDDQRRNRRNRYITHIVAQGDNLYNISKKYEISIDDLKRVNSNIGDDNAINIGQIIRVEAAKMGTYKGDVVAAEPIAADQNIEQKQVVASEVKEQTTATEQKPEVSAQSGYIEHLVRKRETMYGLSRQYGISILDLNNANPSLRSEGLKEGSVIKIPVKSEVIMAPLSPSSDALEQSSGQIVQRKDTLHELSSDTYDHRQSRPAKRFSVDSPVKATLLLPIQVGGKQSRQFAEFYQGFLLGLDSIAQSGVGVDLNILNTGRGTEDITRLIELGTFDDSDIIIGPVYNDQFSIVAAYAASMSIPIVSPLSVVDADNPFIYQVASSNAYRYDKLYDLLEDKRVIIYKSAKDDASLLTAVRSMAKDTITIAFNNFEKPETIGEVMSDEKDNVFVVAANGDQEIDMLLSKLSSVKATNYNKRMSVLGSSHFARSRVDRSNYFKLDVQYISPYHVDRSDDDTFELDRRYISKYNRSPSLFAYRGYDVAVIFFGMMLDHGSDFTKYMDEYRTEILRTTYKFIQDGDNGKIANSEFMLINYTPEYNITVR